MYTTEGLLNILHFYDIIRIQRTTCFLFPFKCKTPSRSIYDKGRDWIMLCSSYPNSPTHHSIIKIYFIVVLFLWSKSFVVVYNDFTRNDLLLDIFQLCQNIFWELISKSLFDYREICQADTFACNIKIRY